MMARVSGQWLLPGWLLLFPVGGPAEEAVEPELLEFLGAVVDKTDDLLVLLDEPVLWAVERDAPPDERSDDEQTDDDE